MPLNKCIFSVITNNYDPIYTAPKYDGWDVILFIDSKPEKDCGWTIKLIKDAENQKCPILLSRKYKILSHRFLPEYDLVCYMDANQCLRKEPPSIPTWFRHDRRQNIYQEAAQIIKNGRFSKKHIDRQIDYYNKNYYKDKGLYTNGFFVRQHSEKINKLHDVWYTETAKFTPRDQLSLPYAIFKTNIYPENIKPEVDRYYYSHVMKSHLQEYKL